MDPVRVLVLAEDPLARRGLSALLSQEEGIVVAGSADPKENASAFESLHPDVLCWDLGHAAGVDLEEIADIASGETPLVVLIGRESPAGPCLAAGARGVLLRDREAERLGTGLRAAAAGLVVIDPELARALRPDRLPEGEEPAERLTPRELEVLSLLSSGLTNRAIAGRLGISEHTAKFHVNSILGKLGAASRSEAIVRAARLGLVIL